MDFSRDRAEVRFEACFHSLLLFYSQVSGILNDDSSPKRVPKHFATLQALNCEVRGLDEMHTYVVNGTNAYSRVQIRLLHVYCR